MHPLSVNPKTGYLESNVGSSFDSASKVRFLELCREFKAKEDKWPDIGSVCDSIGVTLKTFEKHLQVDEEFRDAWEELTLRGEATLTSKMYDLATKNPMYMFGWLRRWNPQRWNPDFKVNISTDYSQVKGALDGARAVFEAELVDKKDIAPANSLQLEQKP